MLQHQEKTNRTEQQGKTNFWVSIFLAMPLFLCIFNKLNAQDKIIGMNGNGGLLGHRGNAFSMNADGSNYQINATFPYIPSNANDFADGNDGYLYAVVGDGYYRPTYVLKVKYDGSGYEEVKKFNQATEGGSIRFRPVFGADGFMYGICENGGTFNNGTIWKMKPNGTMFSVIHTFPAYSSGSVLYHGTPMNLSYNGQNGSLTFGLDGKLYGVCNGGTYGANIFTLNTNGSGFTMLIRGTGNIGTFYPGIGAFAPMILGSDGNFYGCFSGGGYSSSNGVVFKYNPINNGYTVIHAFSNTGFEGRNPYGVAEGAGGNIYGVCYNLGIPNGLETDHGTLWKVAKDGTNFGVLKQLSAAETGTGVHYKVLSSFNKIYFSTRSWGLSASTGLGCIMVINADGTNFRVIKNSFEGMAAPSSILLRQDGGENTFYGLSLSGAEYITKMDTSGRKHQPILGFGGYYKGSGSTTKPLYIGNNSSPYYGKTFSLISATSTLTAASGNLFTYAHNTAINKLPDFVSYMRNYDEEFKGYVSLSATPLLANDGFFYLVCKKVGTQAYLDTTSIFKLHPSVGSQPTIIKKFPIINVTIPYDINSNLIEGSDGYLYGIMNSGGTNARGAVFKMQKDGNNLSYIFQIPSGMNAPTRLLQDTATSKLICSGSNGIFSLETDGTNFTMLPISGGVTNNGIYLLGDTIFGVQNYNYQWNLYKIHKNGTGYTVLRNFTGTANGRYPNSEISIGEDGMIYGSCSGGGTYDYGVVYKIDKNGNNFSILKHFNYNGFSVGGDGYSPGPVVFAPCTTPNNATNISFSRSTNNSITLSGFSAPETGANGYVIKINAINSFTSVADGSNPMASLVYTGGEQVIYNGTSIPTSLTVTGLNPNTTYYFKVFTHNCNARLYSNANTIGNPASYRTTTTGIERVRGGMMRCNGVNQFADAGDVNSLEGNAAISFGGWVKPSAFSDATLTQKSIICKGDGVNTSSTSFFIKTYLDEVDNRVKLSAGISISGLMTPINLIIDSPYFRINQWSHVFVTWQHGETIKLYVNGKLAAQSLTAEFGTINNISSPLRLGSSAATSERTWSGDLEEIQLYNTRLTLCEIRQRMHNTLMGTEAGLQAYYQFNDATTSFSFADYVGSNYATRMNGIANPISNMAVAFGNSYCDAIFSTNLFSTYAALDTSNIFGLNFSADVPNGDINVSYLTENPVGGLPVSGSNVIVGYWIVNNFASNTTNLNATVSLKLPDGVITDNDLSHYTLFKRSSVSFGTWTNIPITAISLLAGNNSISVTGVQDLGQFLLVNTHVMAPATTTWNGSTWSNGTPTSSLDAIIASTIAPSSFTCKNLTINSSFALTNTGITATVNGNITNNGNGIAGTGSLTIADNCTISGNNISFNGVLTVNSGATLNTGGLLTLSSNATNTAGVANSAGNITGNVTVERYFANKRAWRFIAAPTFNASTVNLSAGWQTQTHIVGPSGTGLDAIRPAFSFFTYAPSTWTGVSNTNTTSQMLGSNGSGAKAFAAFLTGDRSVNLNNNSASSALTLSSTGSLLTGTQTINAGTLNANDFFFVANPYASPVDLTSVYNNVGTTSANLLQTFYTWDPNLSSFGGYVTLMWNGAGYTRTPLTGTNQTEIIQSGQAFFTQATATPMGVTSISFEENDKSNTASVNTVFGIGNSNRDILGINLNKLDNGVLSVRDGVVAQFGAGFSKQVLPTEDAVKLFNNEEGITISRNNTSLSIESRPFITNNSDTIFLRLNRLAPNTNYTLNLNAQGWDASMQAFLVDKLLSTETAINLQAATQDLSITSTVADVANRFMIVFRGTGNLPNNKLQLVATKKDKDVQLTWNIANEVGVKEYELQRSVNGVEFATINNQVASNKGEYNNLDTKANNGNNYYRVKTIMQNDNFSFSNIVNINLKQQTLNPFTVFPNPVKNNVAQIQLNNIEEGEYTIRLIDKQGKILQTQKIKHLGGTSSRSLDLSNTAYGIYQLVLDGKGMSKTVSLVKVD
jgi:hypothetical protein